MIYTTGDDALASKDTVSKLYVNEKSRNVLWWRETDRKVNFREVKAMMKQKSGGGVMQWGLDTCHEKVSE